MLVALLLILGLTLKKSRIESHGTFVSVCKSPHVNIALRDAEFGLIRIRVNT